MHKCKCKCVLNTMAEARAPSTRRLYALKWSIFSACCQDRDLDPVTSDVSVVLSFLQEMLDKQSSSSTIKVYAAAIVAFHAPIASRSVGRDSVVIQFLQGARRTNPPHPCTVPPWDLLAVLMALFHCMVWYGSARLGTVRYGSVRVGCISTAV